jgi:hypothetical protein
LALQRGEEIVSNKDTIIEALTMQLKLEREGNLALAKRIAEAEKQEPWVKTYCGGKPNYTTPAEKQERVDETAKREHDLVYRLRKRAEIRRQIPDRKSVQEGQPDRIADLLEEAADALEKREWTEQPDLATVGEVGIWGDKRKWVGLDQVEIIGMTCECVDDGTFNMDCAYDFARAIEAKLKEKNCG